MKVILINGGSREEQDPATKVTDLYEEVLKELEVGVSRIDLYKKMPNMQGFHMLLQESQGVIIAATGKGIGLTGRLQQFFEDCFDRDPELLKEKHGLLVGLALEGGEDYLIQHLSRCFVQLGGYPAETLSGVMPDGDLLTSNESYKTIVEKKLEDFYRILKQKRTYLPSSLHGKKVMVSTQAEGAGQQATKEAVPSVMQEIPMEQHGDVMELSRLFENKLKKVMDHPTMTIIQKAIKDAYRPSEVITDMVYGFNISGLKPLHFTVRVKDKALTIEETLDLEAAVHITIDEKNFYQILDDTLSLQNAFVLGKASVKGQISLLNLFDQCFIFE